MKFCEILIDYTGIKFHRKYSILLIDRRRLYYFPPILNVRNFQVRNPIKTKKKKLHFD